MENQTLTSLLAEKICGNIEKVFYGKRLACQTYVYVNGDTENRIEVIIPLE
ncbi:MAG: hypothetical protein II534_07340 [Clostridia bacterium]|nr:hypothetical protein [Clostridia bacterium]